MKPKPKRRIRTENKKTNQTRKTPQAFAASVFAAMKGWLRGKRTGAKTDDSRNQKSRRHVSASDTAAFERKNTQPKSGIAAAAQRLAFWRRIDFKKIGGKLRAVFRGPNRRWAWVIAGSAAVLMIAAVGLGVALAAGGDQNAGQPQTAASLAEAAVLPTTEQTQTMTPVPTPTPIETTPPEPIETTAPDPIETTPPEPIETTPPDPTPKPFDMDEALAYFEVEADLYYNQMHYSSNYYEYTEEEWFILAQVIDGEAGSQPWEGKVAVGNVVMNRVLAPGYPGSDIKTVVTAPSQFSGYSADNVPNYESKRAARTILDFQLWTVPQSSYNFNSHKPEGEDWGIHTYWKKIGNHNFYYDTKDRGRSRVLSVPPALFQRTFQWPRYGCKAENRVRRLQLMLRKLGYNVEADKYFGMDTVDAVKDFQKKHGLTADGIAGPTTLGKIIREYGIADYIEDFLG